MKAASYVAVQRFRRSHPPRGWIDRINQHQRLSGADPQIPTLHDHVAELHRAQAGFGVGHHEDVRCGLSDQLRQVLAEPGPRQATGTRPVHPPRGRVILGGGGTGFRGGGGSGTGVGLTGGSGAAKAEGR